MTTFGIWFFISIFGILTIAHCIHCIIHWGEDYDWFNTYNVGSIISSIFASLTVSLSALFIIYIGAAICGQTETNRYNVQLYGLSNSSSVHGDFWLGCGQVDGVQYVYYNAKSNNGFLKTYKAELDNCSFDPTSTVSYLEVIETNRYPNEAFKLIFNGSLMQSPNKYIFHLRKQDMNMRNYYDISKY